MAEHTAAVPANIDYTPDHTAALERVFQRALTQVHGWVQVTIDATDVLGALDQERRSHAVYLLEKQGISRLDILNYNSHGISKSDSDIETLVGEEEPVVMGDED